MCAQVIVADAVVTGGIGEKREIHIILCCFRRCLTIAVEGRPKEIAVTIIDQQRQEQVPAALLGAQSRRCGHRAWSERVDAYLGIGGVAPGALYWASGVQLLDRAQLRRATLPGCRKWRP